MSDSLSLRYCNLQNCNKYYFILSFQLYDQGNQDLAKITRISDAGLIFDTVGKFEGFSWNLYKVLGRKHHELKGRQFDKPKFWLTRKLGFVAPQIRVSSSRVCVRLPRREDQMLIVNFDRAEHVIKGRCLVEIALHSEPHESWLQEKL